MLTLFGDTLREWPLPLRILASTLIVVTFVSNVTEPFVRKVIHHIGTLVRRSNRRTEPEIKSPARPEGCAPSDK